MGITQIPKAELIKDRAASLTDIQVCQDALARNISTYSGGSVKERLEANQKILNKIDIEILRRMEQNEEKGE